MTRRFAVGTRIGLAAAVGAGLLAACFSERAQAPGSGQCVQAADSTPQGSPLVHIQNFAFSPANLCVTPGTTVTWRNDDAPAEEDHTTTADDGAWDSPLLDAGGTFAFTFNQAGTLPYHCIPHPFMTAVVTVQ